MSSGIYGIGTSGLLAYQRALNVTAHNIANAATEGYSRQRVELNARPPQFAGNGYFGTGVQVGAVNRIFDTFVEHQLRTATSANEQYATYHDFASRVDSLLADSDSGLSSGMQRFFAALHEVANDPTSSAARQVLLSEADSLVDRFRFLDQRLEEQRGLVNSRITTTVEEINSLADALARLNQDIVATSGHGAAPNDLLDQRDRLVRELAERVNVTTTLQDDGALNVFIGNGQSLVLGNRASVLTAEPLGEDRRQVDIGYVGAGGGVMDITRFMSGGRLGALLDVRSSVLDTAQNALGRIAVGLAESFNQQHVQGQDLDGQPGVDFFRVPEPRVLASATNGAVGLPEVSINDLGLLTTEDYRLRFDGTDWELRRVPGGQVIADPATVGLAIDTSGITGAVAGDSFLIQPTRTGAQQIDTLLSDPRMVAAAGAGGGVGDNANALALAGLQDERILAGGTATLEGGYHTLVAEVGTRTRQAEVASESQASLLARVQAQRESISGVNLDEEAANLLRYQQAYQAAAQVISVTNSLFDTLIDAVRR